VSIAERVITYIIWAFLICLFAQILLSYFPISPGSPVATVQRVVSAVTEPVLRPIRRLLPPMSVGGGSALFDFSPIIVCFGCFIILLLVHG
jgi:YggT family protein